jgi:L-2-hydroxyglutarate oxidase
MAKRYDTLVIGGGIVGLATARALVLDDPAATVAVLEKEPVLAAHQTGRNSGVIHSGIYYRPGSLKARMSVAGSRSMVDYARSHGIPVEVTGKLIAATRSDEIVRLHQLYERGIANGLEVELLDGDAAREHEPHLRCIAAIHVASTGVVDYALVSRAMADDLRAAGGEIHTSAEVTAVGAGNDSMRRVSTTGGDFEARNVINCGGLHSDQLARMAGTTPQARIIPFRGEYHTVVGRSADLVKGLVYPVPDPSFPFLGVHLTRGIDGHVHAGPNAVLALSREGYRWREIDAAEVAAILRYTGFRRLARANMREGLAEMRRSAWKPLMTREIKRMFPGIEGKDLVRSPAGVRAQAVRPDGELVDDFLIQRSGAAGAEVVHVLNAPSPAATASLEIGAEIAHRLSSLPCGRTQALVCGRRPAAAAGDDPRSCGQHSQRRQCH